MRRTYDVPFPLLSDASAAVHTAYKVTNALNDAQLERLKGFGHDIPKWSGEGHKTIAIPSMFLIGKDRTVRWAHANKNHRTRPRVKPLLEALSQVVRAPASGGD